LTFVVQIAVAEELGQRRLHGIVHVDFLLGALQAEFAAPEESNDGLVIGVSLDVGLLLEPLPDGLHVGGPATWHLVHIFDGALEQLRRQFADIQGIAAWRHGVT